ncbi:MAG: helix-turn-helix transcriptional regulator [Rhodospirillales bacterium]|nr:helix-turn-helix transcriptional regulator [Acetobacter sp.]
MPSKILPRNIAGPQVRRLRTQQGITQQAFAEKCQRMGWDVSRDTLAKVESQMRWLADFELAFLAEALSVPLDLLLPERGAVTEKTVREFVTRLSAGRPE